MIIMTDSSDANINVSKPDNCHRSVIIPPIMTPSTHTHTHTHLEP